MKTTTTLYFIFLVVIGLTSYGQLKITGDIDEQGLRQGQWLYIYGTHKLMPLNGKAIVWCNYINDTLTGSYKIFSEDSVYRYYLNAENNDIKGFGYLLENGKVTKTFYYLNINHCFVTEFDEKGKLFRSYELIDDKKNGVYMAYKNGKITVKRYYDMDTIIKEEVNIFNR